MSSADRPAGAASQPGPGALKQCCAQLYESEAVAWLLGESLHPGGMRLTERLGQQLALRQGSRVLDVAAGRGASALFIVERFGCEVVGVDYSRANVAEAARAAEARGLAPRARFEHADAEALPFADGAFDAVLCECAYCIFPDKSRAAREFFRVLKSGGGIGLSDLTRTAALPEALTGLMAWIACIADAQTSDAYLGYLSAAGFVMPLLEPHDEALRELVHQVQGRLLVTEVVAGLNRLQAQTRPPPQFDLSAAKQMAAAAAGAIARHELGYVLISARKP